MTFWCFRARRTGDIVTCHCNDRDRHPAWGLDELYVQMPQPRDPIYIVYISGSRGWGRVRRALVAERMFRLRSKVSGRNYLLGCIIRRILVKIAIRACNEKSTADMLIDIFFCDIF